MVSFETRPFENDGYGSPWQVVRVFDNRQVKKPCGKEFERRIFLRILFQQSYADE